MQFGFSPCPNDTYAFYAMVHGRIDTKGLSFEPVLADIEQLNEWAIEKKMPLTKISYAAFPECRSHYRLLRSGSALGLNWGPLLVAGRKWEMDELQHAAVALPGKFTTASFLFSRFFPEVKNKIQMRFSEIENSIVRNETDAGVIIHESRFTYSAKGLIKLADLGELWEQNNQLPIPLGAIALEASCSVELAVAIEKILEESLHYAREHADEVMPYVRKHSQELDEATICKHIELYVTNETGRLSAGGEAAVLKFFEPEIELNKIFFTQPSSTRQV